MGDCHPFLTALAGHRRDSSTKTSPREIPAAAIMSNPGGLPISTDQLKARYIGTGHADMSKHEWATNQHRDTLASHVGHFDQLSYFAVAQNESIGRVRAQMLEKMLQPCGPPPKKKDENLLG
eukprot:CAMPEP_0183319930 /NCGR_PEP_ID=MMETSP0160_2-20130417/64955_1 /TAXON_ID=2839 ORGANISM="Odontella Sinensis, Strain Grunow 1884" /NCGR_SAMPLE_ID=MMETSP0160_2 /ASSEMBLY_ACC=CAM_ASM_000250 /LENGTH=121 /DNA_ID=CAMNT_0025486523 /DNA_START=66 /DNA_END=431 /DNA_ORIENTATION=+